MFSFTVMPERPVVPIVKCIKTQPAHMVKPAVHVLHSRVCLRFAIFFISFFYSGRADFRNRFIIKKDTDLHQKVVCGGNLRFSVEIV